ncbi:MAG: AAA family ATPase [Bacilli bacterium]|nr:AAA family ATPase [Bacilli bacterium]
MFVGREKEISTISNFLTHKGAMLIYGLKRVGKTTLIKKALEEADKPYIYFECQKASEETNVSLFVDLLREQIGFVDASFDSFLKVFRELDKSEADYAIIIDEYSFMKQYYLESKKPETKERAERLDSEFQNIIDSHLNNLNLFISGSSIHIMERLLEHSSPVYGRFKEKIALREFNYLDAKKMMPGVSNEDAISFYSVFGGSPYVLERLDFSKSLKDNICESVLNEDGRLRAHLNSNVLNEFESEPDLQDILDAIKNGAKKYKEIGDKCHITTSGLLDKKLKKLLELDIIGVRYPIGKENDQRKKYYLIKDNFLKFYYAYVFRQDNRIRLLSEQRYFDLYIEPSLREFISLRFENVVRDYFSLALRKGEYPEIVDIGSYFTGDSEFDCVLKFQDGTYAVYEVKHYAKPLKSSEMEREIAQVKAIKGLDVSKIGFVCSSGFELKKPGIDYLDLSTIFFED